MNVAEINKLGRYELQRELGRGAMGLVFLARDPVIGRTVALKTLVTPGGLDDDRRREYYDRFVQEARAAGQLSHPGIVAVYDAGQDEPTGQFFLALEYVPGRTLRDELGMPQERAAEVFHAIGEALAYAHGEGIVHRDLKPANVLLGSGGAVKITDFGIARVPGSDLTKSGESLGSPAYMSPEQLNGKRVDGRSDLFSLGVLIYEVLTGHRPFEGADLQAIGYQIVHREPPSLRQVRPELSPQWDEILAKLLAKRAEDRYPDASAFLRDLEALRAPAMAPERTMVDGSPGPTGAPSRPAPAASWIGRGFVLAGGATLLGLVLLLVLSQAGAGGAQQALVQVQFRHGLEAGTLRIEVDDVQAIHLRFTGEPDASAPPGSGSAPRKEGVAEIPLHVTPGEHRFLVEVMGNEGQRWSRTVKRDVSAGIQTTLSIHAVTKFNPGLLLEWSTAEDGE